MTDIPQRNTDDYAGQKVQETLENGSINSATGLTAEQISLRRQQFGLNEIDAKEESLWHRVFRRFWGPIPWMIEV